MYFSPTTFVAKILAAMQVLMTLDMPLSTTMALPVTSKPIESTVENLAWQAWIDLPPEQKQQVKSRKVTPKSIFTLPLRVECPEGHKQVDSKCIPIAIGSNAVLIDLNALGLLVGNTPPEDIYDYDEMGEELSNPLAFGSEITAGEAVRSSDVLATDLKPPANDEPLKFNIFQNKFDIFHEEPFEDYAALFNEGLQSSEKEQNIATTTPPTNNATANATAFMDLVSEASNISENIGEFFDQLRNSVSSMSNPNEETKTALHLDNDVDFKIDAISIPASGNHSSLQLVATIMDTETTTAVDEHKKPQESDLTTLLQTESFLPLLNHTTATTLQNQDAFSLTTTPLREPSESSADVLSLGVDEDITTLSTPMKQSAMETKTKQEYIRSITANPLLEPDLEGRAVDASGDDQDNDQHEESTVAAVTSDDTAETTTPIQLDDTTITESHSSFFATTTTQQEELKELLMQQEQTRKTFEELQRMRKGQTAQHVVLKKSKVQPVEVLSTTTEATTNSMSIAATTVASLPTATKRVDELLLTTAETATPLLTVHNENENNDRFYYQQFAKQDNVQSKQKAAAENTAAASSLVAATAQPPPITAKTTRASETETIPLTSEIDLAEELRLINDLVKGIRQPTSSTTITKMPTATTTTTTSATTTTTFSGTVPTTPSTVSVNIESSSSPDALSESTTSSAIKTSTLTTSQIWAKILPLLTTSTITPMPKNYTATERLSESQQQESNATQTSDATTSLSLPSERSHRNSKIIRINGFNKISAAKLKIKDSTTQSATTTEEFTPYYSTTTTIRSSSPASSSTTENSTYEPYWWLPAAWRPDKPTSTEKQPLEQDAAPAEEHPFLLRFWSSYPAKSS